MLQGRSDNWSTERRAKDLRQIAQGLVSTCTDPVDGFVVCEQEKQRLQVDSLKAGQPLNVEYVYWPAVCSEAGSSLGKAG